MKVLIADKFDGEGVEQLTRYGCEVTISPDLQADTLVQAVGETGCRVLIVRSTRVTRETLAAGPELALVIRAGSGYDTIDVDAATDRNIRVCNCPGQNSVAVAELTLGLMIALDRRLVDETDDLRRGVWNKKKYSKSLGLKGRTLGIVGLGKIGYEVARRGGAFEMRLIYCDPIPRPDLEQELGITMVSFEQLLREADFVTVHVPGSSTTEHLVGSDELAMMKPTAFLLNCSRGGIVDEAALADAMKAGRLGGAALDVYEVEPGASDGEFHDPIVSVDHIYGTHHVGASTQQAQAAVAQEAVRIVREYMNRGRFINCVNPLTHSMNSVVRNA